MEQEEIKKLQLDHLNLQMQLLQKDKALFDAEYNNKMALIQFKIEELSK